MIKLSVALDVDMELTEEPIVHCCAPCTGLPVKQATLQQGRAALVKLFLEHRSHEGLGFRLM